MDKDSRRRSRRNRTNGDQPTIIKHLSESILCDILSRLPMKTIQRCRCVCKSWLNLISDPYFATTHFSRSSVQYMIYSHDLILADLDECSNIIQTGIFFQLSPKSLIEFKVFTKIPHWTDHIQVLNSCNGVLCLLIKPPNATFHSSGLSIGWYPFHIYNPVTGEHLVVPQMEMESLVPVGCGLGFSEKTNDFKVLRLLRSKEKEEKALIEAADIQIIGTNTWRSIEMSPFKLRLWSNLAPFVKGALHWVGYGDELINTFDFEEEKFGILPSPSFASGLDEIICEIGTLGGSLCLCLRPLLGFHLWVMKEYGIKESWCKQFVFNDRILSFIGGTVKLMDNGEILLMILHGLILYNPQTKCYRTVVYLRTGGIASVIPHVPSFFKVLKHGKKLDDQSPGLRLCCN